nr:hypothetical protein Iba_scaffold5959CG0110 [Ipomoea batatas]
MRQLRFFVVRDNPLMIDFRQFQSGLCTGHVPFKRGTVNNDRLQVLLGHRNLRFRLMQLSQPLRIRRARRIAFAHRERTVNHIHLGQITIYLRADKRDLPADISIFRALNGTGERPKLPGIQNNQHACHHNTAA